ncbi:MAG: sugar ABC transporter permease [Candidatus Zixiibacteriota bacterium]
MKNERKAAYALVAPAVLIVAVFVLSPIVQAFINSLYRDTPFAPRTFIGFDNYRALFSDPVALGTIEFTLLFVVVSTAFEILIGLGLALVIHERFKGRGLVRAAVLIPWAIPTVVAGVMWKYMLNDQYGFVNLVFYGSNVANYVAWLASEWSARMAIIGADVWKTSSFAALLILAGLQSIPEDLYEAARIDGANAVRRFFRITLPLLRPAILLALLFRMMDAFRVFALVYVMTQGAPGDSTNVLQYYGYQKMFPEQQFGYGSAVSVLVFAMIAIVAVILIRSVRTRIYET